MGRVCRKFLDVVLVLLVCHFPVVLVVVGLDLSDGCGFGGDCVNVFAGL